MIKRTLTFIVLLAAFNIEAHTQSVKVIKATIVMGQKPGVEVEEHAVTAAPERTTVAPFSVSIYELAAK
jgi:hypothetical protein